MKNMRTAIIVMGISFGALLLTIIIVALTQNHSSSKTSTTSATPTITYQPHNSDQLSPDHALIKGILCPDTNGTIPAGIIVAEQIPSRQKTRQYYPGSQATDITNYTMEVEPGTYEVSLQSSTQEKIALYSQYVACVSQEICTDHTSIQFPLEKGQTKSDVNICDYRWKTRFQEPDPLVISPETEPTPTLEF